MAGEVKPLNPRMSPRLDVLLGATDEVNRSRAEQCPSLSVPAAAAEPLRGAEAAAAELADHADPGQRAQVALEAVRQADRPLEPAVTAAEVKAMSKRAVKELVSERDREPTPTAAVRLSLFVKLDRDLDPERRKKVEDFIDEHALRVSWKLDTAAVEMEAPDVARLLAEDTVSYVETGQSLREPQPLLERRDPSRPPSRGVRTARRRHRDGRDVLVGIIDVGGFDFAHPDFLVKGSTRWEAIWDQGGTSRPPPDRPDAPTGLSYGSEIRRAHMDAAIAAADRHGLAATELEPQSTMVPRSHGTHVASIAAGDSGVARKARLAGVLVSLPSVPDAAATSFYDSTRIADAIEYLLRLAAELGGDRPLPLSVNISLGTNGHAHDTSSAMARWIDNALATRGRCVSVAAGNAGQVTPSPGAPSRLLLGRIHAGGVIEATNLRQELRWVVGDVGVEDYSENEMEIWYGPQDRFDVEVRPPSGPWVGPVPLGKAIRHQFLDDGTVLSIHSEAYHPANGLNRISILLSPFYGPREGSTQEKRPITSGEWRVRLTGVVVRDGRFDAWIERDDPRVLAGPGGMWSYPSTFGEGSYTDDRMIGSLACAERLLSVANVDLTSNAAHVTSSRGPTRDGRAKPDIAADGTDVVAASGFDNRSRWVQMTGTSMASPYVCGVAALMLGVSPQLTSAQIQGIMRSTSLPLPGQTFGWRNDTGFGVIDADACLSRTADFADMFAAVAEQG